MNALDISAADQLCSFLQLTTDFPQQIVSL